MTIDPQRAQALFLAALELSDSAARRELLARECAGDEALRQRVEALLGAHDVTGGFGDEPSGQPFHDTIDSTSKMRPGEQVGRYKLLESIGEGGMGTVWVAQQFDPVKRKVAIKLIKAGMDSRQVLARFEAERQALAMMDHPNIAKVFDGGMTAQGRPYFVMEYVKGVPLTEYCDQARLSLKERLQLFMPVCQAVQHAHQKGIIHRDLKPSNILICLYDGKPVPKVIDFGLAKAMHHSLTEQSLFTAHGIMVGTPLYMSPEQAELNNLDVDTRTDIYSLGVILYELLTGTTPLDRDQMKEAAYNEILRLIKEVDPPKPSTRLSGSASLPSVAAQRSIDPRHLSKSLVGDLDWIVMRALDKERSRRYETANGLSRDIERFIHDEAVEARPPSSAYRFQKFVKRNKAQVIAASLIVVALMSGVIGTTLGLVEAKKQEAEAKKQKIAAQEQEQEAKRQEEIAKQEAIAKGVALKSAQAAKAEAEENLKQAKENLAFATKGNEILGSVFEGLDPHANYATVGELSQALKDNLKQAVQELEGSAIGDPVVVAAMQHRLGLSLLNLGDPASAIVLFEKVRDTLRTELGDDHPDTLVSLGNLATSFQHAGRLDLALPLLEETMTLLQTKLGTDDPNTLSSMCNLATAYRKAGKLDLALPLFEETLTLAKANPGADPTTTLSSMSGLAGCYRDVGKLDLALPLYKEGLQLATAKLGDDHPHTLTNMNNLALGYQDAGRLDLALPLSEKALNLAKARLGDDHPETLVSANNLARGYQKIGRLDLALPLLEETLKFRKARLGTDHPETLSSMNSLAGCYMDAGKFDLGLPLYEETLKLRKGKLGADHPHTLIGMGNLATAYLDVGKFDLALPLLEEVLKLRKAKLGAVHPDTLRSMGNLAHGYWYAGKLELALPLYEEAVRLQKAMLGADHPHTLITMNDLASAYDDAMKSDLALPLYEETLKLRKATLGADHPETLNSINNLAACYWRLAQLDKSVPLFEELLPRQEKILGREHPGTQTTVANLGVNYKDANRLTEAIPLLEEAYRSSQKFPPLRWVGLQSLDAYAKAGKLAEATRLIDDLLEDARKTLPQDSPQLAGQLAQFGLGLLEMKGYAEAEPLLRECLAIREKTQPDDWTTFNTQSMLGGALLGQKKYADAEPLLVNGYEGMKAREKSIPPQGMSRITEALERLVELYTDWHAAEPNAGYDSQAADWQKKLDEHSNAASDGSPGSVTEK